ncbi:MAG: phosphotransferase family protein [Gammaproteobacteria bacterium]
MSDPKPYTDLIDYPRLTAWFDAHLPDFGDGPLQAELLAGGTANAVFRMDRGRHGLVLRRPPKVPRADSEKQIAREARVLKALGGTDVPHPRFHGFCDDKSVLGAPFYVMDMVNGWLGWGPPAPPPFDKPGEHRRNMAFALVDAIARLANQDYRKLGLEGFGKPDNFLGRQVDRWRSQLESYKHEEGYAGRDLPGLQYAGDWLAANTPQMSPPGILHGDFSFGNCLFAYDTPTRAAAMIDWELSTIGDPLLDLGWVTYGFNGRHEKTPTAAYFDPTDFPYREELAEYYAERTGRDVSNLVYYNVLAQFKSACILERHYARMLTGRQTREHGEVIGALVVRLAAKAGEMARNAG